MLTSKELNLKRPSFLPRIKISNINLIDKEIFTPRVILRNSNASPAYKLDSSVTQGIF